jgi:hypothetical protein
MRKTIWVFVVALVVVGLLAPAWGQNEPIGPGDTSLRAAPAAGPIKAAAPGQPTILVYEDSGVFEGWKTALDAMGLTYTYHKVAADFITALSSGTWNLVCINQVSITALDAYWDDVEAYLGGGGKLIIFNYTMNNVSGHPLWAAMGAQWQANVSAPENLSSLDPSHSVWARSNGVPTSVAPSHDIVDNGDYMSALAGARAVAYSNTNDGTHVRTICREDHRTILNSIGPSDYRTTDGDADTVMDIVELMQNEVIYVLNNGWSILLLDDFTATLNPRFTNALDRLGLIYTVDTSTATFLNHLAGGNWALVCVYTGYSTMDANWGQLNSYLSAGGRLIVMYWNMDAVPGESLWATMGASWQSDISAAEAVHRWVSGNPLFQRPEVCPDLTSFMEYAGDNGDYIQALAGATALAGLQGAPPDATKARAAMRNDGRSILDTFVAVDYGGGGGAPPDVDGDGVTDVTEWMTNQVAMAGGHEKFTYFVDDRANYAYFDDISATGTALTFANLDDGEATIDIPFNFLFHGLQFNRVRVGVNGLVGFDESADLYHVNYPLPINRIMTANVTDRFFAPFWDDLDTTDGGQVLWQVEGSAPYRRLIVQWQDVPHYVGGAGSSPSGATFQIQLWESWNCGIALYADLEFGDMGYDSGNTATVGVQNDFADGVQYSYNTAALSNGMGIVMTSLPHFLDVGVYAAPANVVSGGTVSLSGGYADWWFHALSTWAWTRTPAIGTFDDASSRNTVWHAPINSGLSDIVVTFRGTATCNGHAPLGDFAETTVTLKWDYDGDTIQDAWELGHGLNPQDAADAAQDPDKDGLTNLQEYTNGTDPHDMDSDNDGFRDWEEVTLGSDPTNPASMPTHGHFNDVPAVPLHWAFHQIEAMLRLGITGGCSAAPPLYCPNSPVTRGQMAKFICVAAGKTGLDKPTPTFADVPKTHMFYGFVERLADAASWGGAAPTSGCRIVGSTKYYCPNDPVARAQMAKFLCIANGKTAYNKPTPTFTDVPASHSFYGWIERLADAASWGGTAVTSGCGCPGTYPPGSKCYCPSANNTRAEMAVFLLRAFGIPY